MINLILASNLNAFEIAILCIVGLCIMALIVTGIFGIYEIFEEKKRYKNACENQHLMFNQLKEGDYMWRVIEDKITAYKIIKVNYKFYHDTLREIKFEIQNKESTWTHDHEVDVKNAKSFKDGLYYLLYKEAKLSADACRRNKDKAIANIQQVTGEEIKAEADKVIERIEKIKEKSL